MPRAPISLSQAASIWPTTPPTRWLSIAYDVRVTGPPQRRFAVEQLVQRLGTGCDALLVATPNALVASVSGKGVGDLTPKRVGQDAGAHILGDRVERPGTRQKKRKKRRKAIER